MRILNLLAVAASVAHLGAVPAAESQEKRGGGFGALVKDAEGQRYSEGDADERISFMHAVRLLRTRADLSKAPFVDLNRGIHTFSALLDEEGIVHEYGKPDEIGVDMGTDRENGRLIVKTSKMIRYGSLRILVTGHGNIWYVRQGGSSQKLPYYVFKISEQKNGATLERLEFHNTTGGKFAVPLDFSGAANAIVNRSTSSPGGILGIQIAFGNLKRVSLNGREIPQKTGDVALVTPAKDPDVGKPKKQPAVGKKVDSLREAATDLKLARLFLEEARMHQQKREFELRDKALTVAVRRFQEVIKNYPETPSALVARETLERVRLKGLD